jgi:hypothetical protein
MINESRAIELIKRILKEHISAKALVLSKDWSIEVDYSGKIDGLLSTQILTSKNITRLVDKYFGFLHKRNISLYDAFLINRGYFPETNIDISYKNEITNIRDFLKENYPEKLI